MGRGRGWGREDAWLERVGMAARRWWRILVRDPPVDRCGTPGGSGRRGVVLTGNAGEALMPSESSGRIPPDQDTGSITAAGAHDPRKFQSVAVAHRGTGCQRCHSVAWECWTVKASWLTQRGQRHRDAPRSPLWGRWGRYLPPGLRRNRGAPT